MHLFRHSFDYTRFFFYIFCVKGHLLVIYIYSSYRQFYSCVILNIGILSVCGRYFKVFNFVTFIIIFCIFLFLVRHSVNYWAGNKVLWSLCGGRDCRGVLHSARRRRRGSACNNAVPCSFQFQVLKDFVAVSGKAAWVQIAHEKIVFSQWRVGEDSMSFTQKSLYPYCIREVKSCLSSAPAGISGLRERPWMPEAHFLLSPRV